jgi:hypothetical protein
MPITNVTTLVVHIGNECLMPVTNMVHIIFFLLFYDIFP